MPTTEDVRADAATLAARVSPGRFMRVAPRGEMEYPPHLRVLDRAITETIAADEGRLIVSVTVRAGKSTLTARWTPAWYLGTNPDSRVILAAHDVGLAAEHAGAARDILTEYGPTVFGPTVDPTSSARARWDLAPPNSGGLLALGVGGSPIGRGADLLLVDDPIKSWEVAENPDARRKINETWWQGTMSSRLEPGASVIIICSRWHEDDLSGFLIREYPGEWNELRLPAIADSDDDPLGREVGDSFWPDRWPAELLDRRRREVSPRVWQAQYQQDPRPGDGGVFKGDQWEYVAADDVPSDGVVYWRGWDLAATEGGGDYTVGVLVGYERSTGVTYVVDVVREQLAPDRVLATMKRTAEADGPTVSIVVPQDPGQAGKDQSQRIVAELRGRRVEVERQTGSKEVRAWSLSSTQRAGLVRVVRSPWSRTFIDECNTFPTGLHDDQVDAAASAFNAASASAAGLRA